VIPMKSKSPKISRRVSQMNKVCLPISYDLKKDSSRMSLNSCTARTYIHKVGCPPPIASRRHLVLTVGETDEVLEPQEKKRREEKRKGMKITMKLYSYSGKNVYMRDST